jgi:hypothetical protein
MYPAWKKAAFLGQPATTYASRSLNKTEQMYSQLEKELYAIVSGCKHFHHYLYGRKVIATTDHKPLKT